MVPISFLDDEGVTVRRDRLPIKVRDDAWVQSAPDGARGGHPYVVFRLFWITPNVLHLVVADGWFTPGDHAVEVDDTPSRLLSHESLPVEQIERYTAGLGDPDESWIRFTERAEHRTDPPVC